MPVMSYLTRTLRKVNPQILKVLVNLNQQVRYLIDESKNQIRRSFKFEKKKLDLKGIIR